MPHLMFDAPCCQHLQGTAMFKLMFDSFLKLCVFQGISAQRGTILEIACRCAYDNHEAPQTFLFYYIELGQHVSFSYAPHTVFVFVVRLTFILPE